MSLSKIGSSNQATTPPPETQALLRMSDSDAIARVLSSPVSAYQLGIYARKLREMSEISETYVTAQVKWDDALSKISSDIAGIKESIKESLQKIYVDSDFAYQRARIEGKQASRPSDEVLRSRPEILGELRGGVFDRDARNLAEESIFEFRLLLSKLSALDVHANRLKSERNLLILDPLVQHGASAEVINHAHSVRQRMDAIMTKIWLLKDEIPNNRDVAVDLFIRSTEQAAILAAVAEPEVAATLGGNKFYDTLRVLANFQHGQNLLKAARSPDKAVDHFVTAVQELRRIEGYRRFTALEKNGSKGDLSSSACAIAVDVARDIALEVFAEINWAADCILDKYESPVYKEAQRRELLDCVISFRNGGTPSSPPPSGGDDGGPPSGMTASRSNVREWELGD